MCFAAKTLQISDYYEEWLSKNRNNLCQSQALPQRYFVMFLFRPVDFKVVKTSWPEGIRDLWWLFFRSLVKCQLKHKTQGFSLKATARFAGPFLSKCHFKFLPVAPFFSGFNFLFICSDWECKLCFNSYCYTCYKLETPFWSLKFGKFCMKTLFPWNLVNQHFVLWLFGTKLDFSTFLKW